MKSICMQNMNWPDIELAVNNGYKTTVIAIGSTAQHGPHLPIKTDCIIGDALAVRVAEKLGNTLQAPTISFGCSDHHLAFAGTISLHSHTLKAIISDYIDCLEKHGFKTIILLPSHSGNVEPVKDAIQELASQYRHLKIWGLTDLNALASAFIRFSTEIDFTVEAAYAHAGEAETSLMLALAENLVVKKRFRAGFKGSFGDEQIQAVMDRGIPALTAIGVLGDPTKATQVKGLIYLERMADFIVAEIRAKKIA